MVDILAEQAHGDWLYTAKAADWRHGTMHNPDKKTDPAICPYSQLTEERKDVYRGDIRVFMQTLVTLRIGFRKMDVLESMFFQAHCSTDKALDHINQIFDAYNPVRN